MTEFEQTRDTVINQVRQLPDHQRSNLLSYLMGYFRSNEEFVKEVNFWLNDPKWGVATRPLREESK